MKSSEVRKTFLQYFEKHGHPILPSSPVVPHGDDTLLFTNAGMVQFKDYFTGASAAPETPRATTVQKCIRAGGKHNDLDNVGYTTRHLTFFEMLGNFSFGDYFKKEAIAFAWELVTEGFGIDPSQLWVTVYNDDDEAHQLWQDVAGVSEKRIARLGEKDNFWSMGDVGPCGPCSEILLDRGEKYGEQDFDNGERFFEIWNLVFMQYEQSKGGARAPLPRPSIDTGMGLERLAIIKQGVDTVFETDVLRTIIAHIEELSGVKYDAGKAGVPHRVLADHARSLVFCLADGAEISNLGRGYVVRRILRRAARYGRKIYDKGPILHQLVKTVIDEMGEAYPEIVKNREFITKQVENEENRFGVTLDRGIEIFDGIAKDLKESGDTTVSGEQAFKLHGTYGFPFDLVQRMSDEAGLEVDEEGYRKALKDAQEISRAGGMPSVASSAEGAARLEALPETDFVGYSSVSSGAELQDAYEHDGAWHLVLSQTPFYAESGGQIGDAGIITSDDFRLAVRDTQKSNGRFVHTCELLEGDPAALRSGAVVEASVDAARRLSIARNHSATHLLHAALRSVIGTHVQQKGSLVSEYRLRFDVTHFSAITPEELDQATELVREQVLGNVAVEISEMGHAEAVEAGAMAFFGEKYGETVRVVRMGDFSMELCGGIHVGSTGEIGPFLVVNEGSVSSGVRRLEALTAGEVEAVHRANSDLVLSIARELKARPEQIAERISKLLEDNRSLKQALEKETAAKQGSDVAKASIGDLVFASGVFDEATGKELRAVYDSIKDSEKRLICAFVARKGPKAQVLLTVSDSLVKDGWAAKTVFEAGAELLGARGGGKPHMLQAGGTVPDQAEAAVAAFKARVEAGL